MTDLAYLADDLSRRQNSDGGWPYNSGSSWTEPTALSLLALHCCGRGGAALDRGIDWIRSRQRSDGGWSPNDAVTVSSSVTSTCLLALGCAGVRVGHYDAGIRWTLSQAKPDFSLSQRFAYWLAHLPVDEASTSGGCPWFPGTAAWVQPTTMMTLALVHAIRFGYTDPNLAAQVERARRFLLARRCPDGGWNHGGLQFRTPDPTSYPEVTGLALLAFDPGDPRVGRTISLAGKMAADPMSSEAQSWLRMALIRHNAEQPRTSLLPPRTNRDLALQILSQSGRDNPLIA